MSAWKLVEIYQAAATQSGLSPSFQSAHAHQPERLLPHWTWTPHFVKSITREQIKAGFFKLIP